MRAAGDTPAQGHARDQRAFPEVRAVPIVRHAQPTPAGTVMTAAVVPNVPMSSARGIVESRLYRVPAVVHTVLETDELFSLIIAAYVRLCTTRPFPAHLVSKRWHQMTAAVSDPLCEELGLRFDAAASSGIPFALAAQVLCLHREQLLAFLGTSERFSGMRHPAVSLRDFLRALREHGGWEELRTRRRIRERHVENGKRAYQTRMMRVGADQSHADRDFKLAALESRKAHILAYVQKHVRDGAVCPYETADDIFAFHRAVLGPLFRKDQAAYFNLSVRNTCKMSAFKTLLRATLPLARWAARLRDEVVTLLTAVADANRTDVAAQSAARAVARLWGRRSTQARAMAMQCWEHPDVYSPPEDGHPAPDAVPRARLWRIIGDAWQPTEKMLASEMVMTAAIATAQEHALAALEGKVAKRRGEIEARLRAAATQADGIVPGPPAAPAAPHAAALIDAPAAPEVPNMFAPIQQMPHMSAPPMAPLMHAPMAMAAPMALHAPLSLPVIMTGPLPQPSHGAGPSFAPPLDAQSDLARGPLGVPLHMHPSMLPQAGPVAARTSGAMQLAPLPYAQYGTNYVWARFGPMN